MDWIQRFQLFLFDFDGLLVNTEEIHFLAYNRVCASRGVYLEWTFADFCQIAHYHSTGLSDYLYGKYPQLKAEEPDWNVLYAEKRQEVLKICKEENVNLMPGVKVFLEELDSARILSCVVTHSPKKLIELIRSQHPCLQSIPHWITREDYHLPKPNPECYKKAIAEYSKANDQIIGFEDTPRGLRALMGTRARPVLISRISYPEIPEFISVGVRHFTSFDSLLKCQDLMDV